MKKLRYEVFLVARKAIHEPKIFAHPNILPHWQGWRRNTQAIELPWWISQSLLDNPFLLHQPIQHLSTSSPPHPSQCTQLAGNLQTKLDRCTWWWFQRRRPSERCVLPKTITVWIGHGGTWQCVILQKVFLPWWLPGNLSSRQLTKDTL